MTALLGSAVGEPGLALAGEVGATTDVGTSTGNRTLAAGQKGDASVSAATTGAGASAADEPRPDASQRTDALDARARAERTERVLDQIRLRIRPELREAVVELEPRELGRIAIRLSVHQGRVRASLRAERAEAAAVLEAHVPELRAMLEAAGLEPHALDVSMGWAHGSRHPSRDGDERSSGGSPRGHAERAAPIAASEALAAALLDAHGIDTYA